MFSRAGAGTAAHLSTDATPFTALRAYAGDFGILYWFNPAHTGSTIRELFYAWPFDADPAANGPLTFGWTLRADKSNNILRFRMDGTNRNLSSTLAMAQGDPGLWLFGLSADWDGAAHDCTFMLTKLGGTGLVSAAFNNLTFTNTTQCGFGCIDSGSTADVGNYGMLVVRNHTFTTTDLTALASGLRYTDIVYSSEGNMTGKAGVLFAMGLGITPDLDDINDNYDGANNDGLFVYSSYDSSLWNDIDGTITSSGTWTHRSPYDRYPTLLRYTPSLVSGVTLPTNTSAGRTGARTREILRTSHSVNTRFLFIGNSRAVRAESYDDYPQNYGHGFIADDAKLGWVGVDFAPPYDAAVNSWAFITGLNGAVITGANVTRGNTAAATDFSRWGTNSQYAASLGMGEQVHVGATSSYRWMGDSTWGDLVNTDTIEVKTYFLAYPGSANATVEAATAPSQTDTASAAYTSSSTATLQTTESSHTCVAANDTLAAAGVTLDGVTGLGLALGDVCYNETQNDIAVIATAGEIAGDTVITFDTDLGNAPVDGDVLRFGPWSIVTVTDTIVGTGSNDNFKGQRITHAGTGGAGAVVILGLGFRATNRTGNILCTMGGGGDGAADQIAEEASGNIAAITAAINPHVIMFTPPTQSSSWATNGKAYINILLAAAPNADYVLLGDPLHTATADFTETAPAVDLNDWNGGFLSDPLPTYALAVDCSRGAGIGLPVDRMADGQHAENGDAAHYSTRGNTAFAVEWKRLIDEAIGGGSSLRNRRGTGGGA